MMARATTAALWAGLLGCLGAASGIAAAGTIVAADPHVARMGRAEIRSDGAVHFAYPGVSFYASFDGTRVSMAVQAGSANSYLDVIVDGGAARKLHLEKGTHTVVLAQGLAAGPHTVEIVNRSETWLGQATVSSFDTDGAWLPAPALPQRKLLVLGDSITCGEAIDRVAGEMKNASWWDARASYGMLLARDLHAQVQLVCAGGRGLIRSWDNRTDLLKLPEYYQLAIADQQAPVAWDQRDYQPGLILVAIGTNDFNVGIPDRAQYVDTYVRFVRTLLADHPQAQVVLTEGAMLKAGNKTALVDYINATVRGVGDPRVHAIASKTMAGDALDGHPTRSQNVDIANDLLPQLRAIAHW